MMLRSEDTLMGLVALALVPWIAIVLRRGLRGGRLPIGRTYVARAERPGAFAALLLLYAAAIVLMIAMAADLLLDLRPV